MLEPREVLEGQDATRAWLKQADQFVPWVFLRLVATRRDRTNTRRRARQLPQNVDGRCRAAGVSGPASRASSAGRPVQNLVRATFSDRVVMTMTEHTTRSVLELRHD
jgi:hypothetical protein